MFKSKWQRRYEDVYRIAVFWRDFYRECEKDAEADKTLVGVRLQEIYSAQAITMSDLVNDMERIRGS